MTREERLYLLLLSKRFEWQTRYSGMWWDVKDIKRNEFLFRYRLSGETVLSWNYTKMHWHRAPKKFAAILKTIGTMTL